LALAHGCQGKLPLSEASCAFPSPEVCSLDSLPPLSLRHQPTLQGTRLRNEEWHGRAETTLAVGQEWKFLEGWDHLPAGFGKILSFSGPQFPSMNGWG
jgi:hypothetical protein